MKIQKIDMNTIRIILDSVELEENNISTHSFLSNSNQSKQLIASIIESVNKKLHFANTPNEINYNVISFANKIFILILSKNNCSTCLINSKNETPFNDIIFKFENLSDFIDFIKIIKKYAHFDISFNLYELKSYYYIKIDLSSVKNSLKNKVIAVLSEFITPIYLDSVLNAYFFENAIFIKTDYL